MCSQCFYLKKMEMPNTWLEYDQQMNSPASVFKREGRIILSSKSSQLVSHSSFEMQLAGALHLYMCLDASLQGTPTKQRKGDSRVAGTGHRADVAEDAVWEYF